MACIPIKKYLKNNEDMKYDSYGTNRWKLISMEYLDALFSGFSFEGTKLHEELMELILHLFKSNPLKFNEKENLYGYEFKCGSWIYRYYPNGLITRYVNYGERNNLLACHDKNDDIIAYKPYELPERIKKEIEEKAKEAEEKAKEKLEKEIETAAKKSVSPTRKRKPIVIPPSLDDCTRYSLAFYQGAKWSNCKGYVKIPNVTKYPIYKIIDKLKAVDSKLNRPIGIKANKDIICSSDMFKYNTVEAIQSAIYNAIENTLKTMQLNINCDFRDYQIGRLITETPLSRIFNSWTLKHKPIAYFLNHSSEDDFIKHCASEHGEYHLEACNMNENSVKEFSAYLRENSEEEENCYYLDEEFEYHPDKHMGATIKLVPNVNLSMLLIAYDKYVEFVKTLPFGEEWMIRNTIIPPPEDDKKGKNNVNR